VSVKATLTIVHLCISRILQFVLEYAWIFIADGLCINGQQSVLCNQGYLFLRPSDCLDAATR
jgi:hypothetical protein